MAVVGFCILITGKSFWKTATAATAGYAIIVTLEVVQLKIALSINADYFVIVAANPWMNILATLPYSLLMLLMLYTSKKYHWVLFNSAYLEIE